MIRSRDGARRGAGWALLAAGLAGCASGTVGASSAPPSQRAVDEAHIRAFIERGEADTPFVNRAPDLDWENAFGIRYDKVVKMDAFFGQVVAPLQVGDTGGTFEVRIRFIGRTIAVADEYWHEVGQRDVDTLKRGPDRWGRTTYLFERAGGRWIERIERVADLRMAYYRHYDALPAPVPLPSGTLASLEGTYRFPTATYTLSRAGDRFAVVRRATADPTSARALTGIPVSATSVLLFDPNDLAEYSRLEVSDGVPVYSRAGDDPAAPGIKGSREAP